MLVVVAFRNLLELVGSHFDFSGGFFLPRSFGTGRNSVLWTISSPVLTVLASEMAVDWLKHAFITKFNHIRPSVYERYTDVLCRDLASGSAVGRRGPRKHGYVDQSPLVARRLGFAALPLSVLAILLGGQIVSLLFSLGSDGSAQDHMQSIMQRVLAGTMEKDEIIRYAKWVALSILSWAWYVLARSLLVFSIITD
jgi:hypothetical protein